MNASATRPAVKAFYDRHITPALSAFGYARSGRTYRIMSDVGDTAVVNFQVSSGTHRTEYQFYVNLAIAPLPWVDYIRSGTSKSTSAPVQEYDGLLRARVDPPGAFRWTLTPSLEVAHETGQRVVAALDERVPELTALLDRDTLTDRLRTGEGLSNWFGDRRVGLIALLTEQGPSDELDELLLGIRPDATKFQHWVQARVDAAR